jgi:lipopolysaccharide/colanic/teichoic acid biosynthesis glycosyltransferase
MVEAYRLNMTAALGHYTQKLIRYTWWKDILDRVIALLVLIVISPFLAIIAIIIKVDSPGSPIFRQERVGENRHSFRIYKFRTMYRDNDDSKYKALVRQYVQEGITSNLDENYNRVNNPRVTKVGAVLRKLNLDELPQLFNILKGDMVFVGPRPDIPFAVEMYQERHLKRLSAKPGLTGLWQVSGRRNVSFEDMVKLDIEYIEKQSPLLDLKILLLTLRMLLVKNGAASEEDRINLRTKSV